MLNGKEILSLLIAMIIFAFVVSFPDLNNFALMFLFGFIIIFIYVLTKKLVAYYLETDIEMKIWSFQRYGLYERSYFKKPIPIGIILPFILTILSFGYIDWIALLQTDEKASKYRVAKRHDFYSFSELTEWHIGLIAASGIIASLILAIIAYLINQPILGKFAIFYASFNMIPIGKLDGTKIFFGSKILWVILAVFCFIFLGYVFFLP